MNNTMINVLKKHQAVNCKRTSSMTTAGTIQEEKEPIILRR